MVEIPAVKPTDAEDVVWGLQTAETLWKRGEKIDALVWLRRAAQAAGDANDDDRALELARYAAELTDYVAKSDPPPGPAPTDADIDIDVSVSLPPAPPVVTASSVQSLAPDLVEELPESVGRDDAASVLPAEKVHAGLFDPWADGAGAPSEQPTRPRQASIADVVDDDGVATSVTPSSPPVVAAPKPAAPAPRPPPKAPPPLPARAKPPLPKAAGTQPPAPAVTAPPAPAVTAPPPEPVVTAPPPEPVVTAPPAPAVTAPPAAVASAPPPAKAELDLGAVEAFSDLPDDARAAFAAAAKVHPLAEGEEIGSFALAYVVSGAFDVAATMVDAPAARLNGGAVLRSRGTTEENVPIRLICAAGNGVVATWSDTEVEEAFRTIPWVEEDLRAASDRVQTLVGITIGPLGERLDPAIREEILGRLTMRSLLPGEIVVKEGEPVPGLLLVGVGELELVKSDAVIGKVTSGDFLFPTEVLGAGSSPATVRAASGGALVMFGGRGVAQELLVTCPPLLEVFAGM